MFLFFNKDNYSKYFLNIFWNMVESSLMFYIFEIVKPEILWKDRKILRGI